MKNTHRIASVLILAALAVTSLAACDDDSSGSSSSTDDAAADSAYCQASIDYQITDFYPTDESDPAAVETYANNYNDFLNTAIDTAPDEIVDDWTVIQDRLQNQIDVLEKYDWTFDQIRAEGTNAEKNAFADEPPDFLAAQDATATYDAAVCVSVQPPAADVSFDGPPPADYCKAVRTYVHAQLNAVYAGGDE